MDGLKDKFRTAIIEIIARNPRIEQAVLFGSRAMATFTTTSDVDIALFGAELTIDDQSKIMAAIEDLTMPQRADVLIYNKLTNEKLRQNINEHGIIWYVGRKNI